MDSVTVLCACVRACVKTPGDDILIFVNSRLEATVSQSPMVKGKNKSHARMCARARTHTHHCTVTHYDKATHNSEHKKQHVFLVEAVLLAVELPNFSRPVLLLFSLSLCASGGQKQVSCLIRLR